MTPGALRAFKAVESFIEEHQRNRPAKPGRVEPVDARSAAQKGDRDGQVYFITYGESGPIKIGFTSNFDYRLQHLQTSCPYPLVVLGMIDATPALEYALHQQFREHRMRGEWFSPSPDILAEIERLCERN